MYFSLFSIGRPSIAERKHTDKQTPDKIEVTAAARILGKLTWRVGLPVASLLGRAPGNTTCGIDTRDRHSTATAETLASPTGALDLG